jgi:hypothetical protein
MTGLGACAGLVLYTGAQWAKKAGFLKATLNRNHGMFMVMSSFALGTFLAASKTGIEEVHVLHPIFRAGAVDNPQTADVVDRMRLQQMRMTRRKTLMDNLQHGHGLSDSHAGRWVEENSETKFEKD